MLSRTDRRPWVSALVAVAVALPFGACARGDGDRPAQTATTGLTIPRPETTGITKHTIDNAGFVDNGGRTSDMTARTEMSGMRATEAGSERLTGTPGSGAPVPIPPSSLPRNVGEVLEGGRTPTASPRGDLHPPNGGRGLSVEASSRVARARCDWETTCNHIGVGQRWASQDSCIADQRDRLRSDFASITVTTCPRGIADSTLGACLDAMRNHPCADVRPELDSMSECHPSALCAP